jgi:hypothetical protein
MSRFDYLCLGYVLLLLFFGFSDEPVASAAKTDSPQYEGVIAERVRTLKREAKVDTSRSRAGEYSLSQAQHRPPSPQEN